MKFVLSSWKAFIWRDHIPSERIGIGCLLQEGKRRIVEELGTRWHASTAMQESIMSYTSIRRVLSSPMMQAYIADASVVLHGCKNGPREFVGKRAPQRRSSANQLLCCRINLCVVPSAAYLPQRRES